MLNILNILITFVALLELVYMCYMKTNIKCVNNSWYNQKNFIYQLLKNSLKFYF